MRELKLETIEKMLKDDDWRVRAAAMNACQGRDVPIEIIERGLKDEDWRVRDAAMHACKINGLPVPVIRTIEPPRRVYKKCLNGVIAIAEIPSRAQIRGSLRGKCRTDRAKIVEIDGEICGEQVGISLYDLKTTYFIGDSVEIDNFDYSDKECSTGFHFFCSIDDAIKYNP